MIRREQRVTGGAAGRQEAEKALGVTKMQREKKESVFE